MGFGIEFCLQVRLGRTAHAGALWTTDLRHESINHAVKDDAVVKAFAGQLLDAFDMAGGQVGTQVDFYRAFGGFEEKRIFRVCHEVILLLVLVSCLAIE